MLLVVYKGMVVFCLFSYFPHFADVLAIHYPKKITEIEHIFRINDLLMFDVITHLLSPD